MDTYERTIRWGGGGSRISEESGKRRHVLDTVYPRSIPYQFTK